MGRRSSAWAGHEHGLWPALLLIVVVLLPTLCLLWFLQVAMRNERLAARERLAEAYRGNLAAAQQRLADHWKSVSARLGEFVSRQAPPGVIFAQCVHSNLADAVVVFGADGRVLYPDLPVPPDSAASELSSEWLEAARLEQRERDFAWAAVSYGNIAAQTQNPEIAARAWQARARCLRQNRDTAGVLQVVMERLANYDQVRDPQGRLILPNAQLMALELMTNAASTEFQQIAGALSRRLSDYARPGLPSTQRRFLMKQMQRLAPQAPGFPTLPAEELAARWLDNEGRAARTNAATGLWKAGTVVTSGAVSGGAQVWEFSSGDARVRALFDGDRLAERLQSLLPGAALPVEAQISLVPPGRLRDASLAAMPAGDFMPDWTMTLSVRGTDSIETATAAQRIVYLWIGILVVTVVGILTVVTVWLMRRQAALANMKNDLVAAVSHELKTPLASMRLLVDTLLDTERPDPERTREYLQLISRENIRLSRLIDNFLTFSRLERNRYVLRPELIPAGRIARHAAEAVQERFDVPGCSFMVEIPDDLPELWADEEALTTALVNLLDNAFKYSQQIKRITLSASARGALVLFAVNDNGIGVPPRELRRIFARYYQVDRRLSRHATGCGLGLSIVRFIVEAHQGRVDVISRPGTGSTFTIQLPVTKPLRTASRQAAA